jgi:RNA polymerase sigma factor (sigma-70 family)
MDAALNTTTVIRDFPSLLVAGKSEINQPETEGSLWLAFTKGNRAALNSIFDNNIRTLYSYGNGITKDRDLVADCIQDIFVELWSKRENLANDVKHVKFYLIKALRRKILRRLSDEERFLREETLSEGYIAKTECSAEVSLIEYETSEGQAKDIQNAISTLSIRQQEAVHLKFFENMSYENIASVMDIDVKAAYNLVSKSILLLRKTLTKSPVR